MSLILASTSPRRKDLLALLQVPFQIAEPTFVEHLSRDRAPDEQAMMFAEGKARSCAARFPGSVILGSDTLIALDGEVMGKPSGLADARSMLLRLRGRVHAIHTAVALLRQSDAIQDAAVETVLVWMRPFDETELEAYLHTGESLGKAGAYSIQGVGGRFIERIEGDYTAAVGLPLRLVAGLLRKRGVTLPIDVEQLYRDKPYPNWAVFQR
jgi:septum formation protein